MPFKSSNNAAVEVVEFNGRRYRRYPESKNPAHRKYFSRAGARLHRDVWLHYRGPIPAGYHVHHIDGDTSNNDISNLECTPAATHRAEHRDALVARSRTPRQLKHLANIRTKAAEWHKSAAGRAWHKQHVHESLAKTWDRPRVYVEEPFVCAWCGKHAMRKIARRKYCGSACQTAESKWRRGKSRYEHPHHAARVRPDG